MAETFRMKQNDLRPPLRAQLLDGETPIDLSAASSARIIVTSLDKTTELLDRAVTIDVGNTGWVEMEWQAGDTTTVGRYLVEYEVTWPGAKPQTFPVDGYAWLVIGDDLG
jgi:hypothetical protein